MNFGYIDTHVHLQDMRLQSLLEDGDTAYGDINLERAIINGTHPDDWKRVQQLCLVSEAYKPAYGVHPWNVKSLPSDWFDQLKTYLKKGAISLGEIGLDQVVDSLDNEQQEKVFCRQWELAKSLDITPSVHCVKAWNWMESLLKEMGTPNRGWLLHGFSGSQQEVDKALDLGASLSFSAWSLDSHHKRAHQALKNIPLDRLLIETDAPNSVPSTEHCIQEMNDRETGDSLNHPVNLKSAYAGIAKLRSMEIDELAKRVSENFERLFTP